jgi:hypothetical protein
VNIVYCLQSSETSSFQDAEVHGREGVISLYRGLMASFPDGIITAEPAKMTTIQRPGKNGTRETVRVVVGLYTHKGKEACSFFVTL